MYIHVIVPKKGVIFLITRIFLGASLVCKIVLANLMLKRLRW